MADLMNVQSAASESAAVHDNNGHGHPKCPAKPAKEYRLVSKPVDCVRCKLLNDPEFREKENTSGSRRYIELEDTPSEPDEISPFWARFTYKAPGSDVVTVIEVHDLNVNTPDDAIEAAVGKMTVRVGRETVWNFEPGAGAF